MATWPDTITNLIAGDRVGAVGGGTIDILNPHDATVLARLARSGAADVANAVAAARAAQAAWAATPSAARGDILHRACNLLEERKAELADIVAMEAGKRKADALGEAAGAVACGRFFAGEGQRLFGRTMGSGVPARWNLTLRTPCGVAALITAANAPAPNFAWKVFPALICGNAVVLKPAEDTPISAWFMARVLEDAGLPAGVLNVVNGLGAELGPALIGHAGVDVLSFTGSSAVGRQLAEQGGRVLKKLSLELGGKNAFVVWRDADIPAAVRWATASSFSNAGQRCSSGSRLIVHEAIYDVFVEAFLSATADLTLGVGDDCDIGPVINQRQLERIVSAIGRAKGAGARILAGGAREILGTLSHGYYLQPTVLEGADHAAAISRDEIFGPVCNLYKINTYEDAVALANDCDYGLTSTIHTRDFDRALAFCRDVSVGVVTVNGGTFGSEPHMPFGGVRASGNGTREPGTEALDVYTNLRNIYFNVAPET